MKKLLFTIILISASVSLSAQNTTVIKDDLLLRGDSDTTPFGVYGKRLFFGTVSDNSWDPMWIGRINVRSDASELRINVGDDGDDKLVVGRRFMGLAEPTFTPVLIVQPKDLKMGYVGINQYNPQYPLDVNGVIHAKEVKIDNNGWADFVFDVDYKLRSLIEVEAHIEAHKSLPEIPTEAEVKENGVNIGEMQVKLLQKIEELTLYTIQQQKQLDEQSKSIEAQGKLIQELQNKK